MVKTKHNPYLLLDLIIVVIGMGLMFLSLRFGLEPGHPVTKGTGAVLGGIYLIYLGTLFLLSYFFSGAGYVFKLLMFVCESFSRPTGRHMAFVYFAISLLVGLSLILAGLGFL